MTHDTSSWAQTIPAPDTLAVHATEKTVRIPQTLAIHGPGECPEAAASFLSTFLPLHCTVSTDQDTADITIAVSGNPCTDAALSELRTDDETWTLECRANEPHARIRVHATGFRGAMRAIAYLTQVLAREQAHEVDGPVRLCPAAASGRPCFAWRGVMLDCARHFFRPEFVRRYIDLAALHGMSVFHWHLTDDQGWRVPSEAFPQLNERGAWRDDGTTHYGSYGGFYSPSEIMDVVTHAARRGMIVVPEIDIPGHTRAAIHAIPELSCRGDALPVSTRWGIFEDVLCAGSTLVHDFVRTVFDELCGLFPGPYIHVGGDECPTVRWQECAACQSQLRELGSDNAARLHGHIMDTAVRTIRANGRRAIGWDEILDGGLTEPVSVMCWRDISYRETVIAAGHEVVVCPTKHACYFDHKHTDSEEEPGWLGVCTVADTCRFEPGHPERVLGAQGNLWTERVRYGRQAEYMVYPRAAALAANLWRTTSDMNDQEFSEHLARVRSHAQFLRQLGVHAYDGPTGS
ncbi:MAG: beta-N-acetylhexosaminidase [Spirochaetaceae bacterium]|nr:MAG: beta-N-acetylhexosaminidase [Spirochaetaceae bacterium]